MLGRRGMAAGGLALVLGACAGDDPEAAKEPSWPTRTSDGRIIVRGNGAAYAIRPPTGWSARSVPGADRSTRSTVTVADLAPPDGSPVSISGQMRTRTREFDSIDSWIERVTQARRAENEAFTLRRAGPVRVRGRKSELVVLETGTPSGGPGSSIDHEAVVLIEEPGVIVEIFLTTNSRELRDLHLSTLRAVAASYSPAV